MSTWSNGTLVAMETVNTTPYTGCSNGFHPISNGSKSWAFIVFMFQLAFVSKQIIVQYPRGYLLVYWSGLICERTSETSQFLLSFYCCLFVYMMSSERLSFFKILFWRVYDRIDLLCYSKLFSVSLQFHNVLVE